ncbi:MAG: carbamoyl phosphate synthase large subunit, partial [Fibrobacter sp.]|nr:carbamoyl phosphate synthase large subunit [Fibrobacter sp.]
VCGLMNMQYAIEDGKVFVLEANPRASRTVPLVSKVCNTQMARLATRLMLGEKLEDLKLKDKKFNHHGAKEAVFPFDKFPKVDPVLGLSDDYALAYYKSQEAAGSLLPSEGAVLISLSDKVNLSEQAIEIGKEFQKLGFKIYATEGTAKFYEKAGVKCEVVNKIAEGRPNVLDIILNKQVNLVINTPWAKRDAVKDESAIRKAAIKYKVPYITTLAGAYNTVKGIAAAKKGHGEVKSLQEYHASIEEI